MRRSRVRKAIERALVPLLEPDEELRAGASVWMADRRPRVPLLLTGRAIYLVAVTNRRLLVFDTPRRARPLLEADLLLAKQLDALTLRKVSTWRPLFQVRIAMGRERQIVLEFRPRDRAAGRALLAVLHAAHASTSSAPEHADATAGAGPRPDPEA